jgi:acetyl-CoA carboxylase carboxyl transferase alpha subunit
MTDVCVAAGKKFAEVEAGEFLWSEVGSTDFLDFGFAGIKYTEELTKQAARSKEVAAVKCSVKILKPANEADGAPIKVLWMEHDFAFFGGSLGCAEGEKLTRGFEYAAAQGIPVIIWCATGGARMHEGTLSLMQMAKVSCAVRAFGDAGLPFVSILADPCYGGVSASYAMQADVRIGITRGRLGFSGPAVILNTQYGMNQGQYDKACPDKFQSNEFGVSHGYVDFVSDKTSIESATWSVLAVMTGAKKPEGAKPPAPIACPEPTFDYTKARNLDRLDANDILREICSSYVELGGDGKGPNGLDKCLRCGLATLKSGRKMVVMKCAKGHTPMEREAFNHAMPTPQGYRTALRFFALAERFGLPVVTLVDTVGAWPSFDAETAGQSEAIATNLTAMAGLKVPIITIVVSEGGSGGALAIAMGNKIGMLSGAWYSTISPEGAASILGRYKDEAEKKEQFPKDCVTIATMQNVYAPQLKKLGIIDDVIWEKAGENMESFPTTANNLVSFLETSLDELQAMPADKLTGQRYSKFRAMGKFKEYAKAEREALVNARAEEKKRERPVLPPAPKIVQFLTERTLKGENSFHKGKGPKECPRSAYLKPVDVPKSSAPNAKSILDSEGPEAMAKWVRATSPNRVLLTDTTMRDAHQSHFATRMRTTDMLKAAPEMSKLLHDYFSLECWGGATFDVSYRFLNEDSFRRLRKLREKVPNICFQMLLRGANGVGYKSYPDNVVADFVRVAAKNGMDVFRIFDCFNDIEQMKVSINAVRQVKKVAEVAMCFTGDFLSPKEKIYTLEYYKDLCKKCVDAGAHMIAVKDMAGLLKPGHAAPLMKVIREVCDLPVHFHTHNTSSAQLATLHAMADAGCDVVDGCFAALADGTSQPSLNAFVATRAGMPRDPLIDYKLLEPLDQYWAFVRDMYSPFESGMKAMTARVFEHQIPGGQYSNMYAQCRALGGADEWDKVLTMYADVNAWCGDVVKVTPSSKSVGDIALFLLKQGIEQKDFSNMEKMQALNWPQSAIELARGEMGMPHRGFPKDMQDAILKGKLQPMVGRPGDTLEPEDFAKVKKEMEDEFKVAVTEEDVQAFLMYPAVFRGYMKHVGNAGPLATYLPTPAFFYGLEVGEKLEFEVPGDSVADAESKGDHEIPLKKVSIQLSRVGPCEHEDIRTLEWIVDGKKVTTKMVDPSSGKVKYAGPMADAKNKSHVSCPLPGAVAKMEVSEGQELKKDAPMFTIAAMKMEVVVRAPADCTVTEVCVAKDQDVVDGALLAKLKL